MLKNWVSKALDGLFGDLFEKMPNSQFELNKWQGVGENKNLRIKEQRIKQLFAFLGYDFDVVEATIGIFQFKIPWNRLWKEPSKIVIKDALIHVQTKGIFSQEFQQQYEQIVKQSLIQKLENKFLKKIDSQQKGSYLRSLKNYFQEMIIIEIENLELKIEDRQVCLRNQSFFLNLGFQKLTIQPFTYDNQKKAQVFKFNTENLYCSFITNDQRQDMIEPLSIMVTMIKYDDNITNKQINIQLDQIVLNINNLQFLALIRLNQLRDWSRQQGEHLKYRPKYNIRPKHDRLAWQEYFTNIVYILKDRISKGNIEELKQSFIRRREYLDIFLIYQLSIISDQKNFKLVLKNQEQIVDSSQILGLVKEYEQLMLFEEIKFQREKVYKIIQDEEQLKIKLQEYEYEQNNQSPSKKQSIMSRLTSFWRRNNYQVEETKMEQLLNLLKFQQIQTEIVNVSRTYSVNFKKLIVNYAIFNGNAQNFMTQEVNDINFRYIVNKERKEYRFSIQNLTVYDKITQNKDYQVIFQSESRSKYQQQNLFYNHFQRFKQSGQIFEFSYISDVKKQIAIQIQPIICCFNDTILVRLQSFLVKIQKGDQFILLINKKDKNKVTAKQWIKDLFDKDMIQIDLQMNGLIFILPENSARLKCNYLLFMIESIKLQSTDKIQLEIQKLELLFVYYDDKKKKEQMIEPLKLYFTITRKSLDGIGYLEFDNTLSDIIIKVPLLYAEFLQNYIDNIISTWNNITKIQNAIEEDNWMDLRRKVSQARSYCSSIPKQDDASSNNGSEKFYDADEYFNLDNHEILQSTLEKRELMINKWRKLENQFIYFIDKVYKKADPFIQTAIQLIDIKSLTKCQLIKIIVITDKYKEKISYFEVNQIEIILNKSIKTTKFQVVVNLRDSCLSLYKLETIFKVYSYIHQYKHKLNRYLKKINLIPWLLKLQKLDIDFKILCDNHKTLFQNSWNQVNQDILIMEFKNLLIVSNHPFSIRYKDLKINKPSFVKIDSFQMCNIITNFSVYFKIKVQILNFNIREQESLLDETNVDIQVSQTLAQQDITLKLNHLWINFSPSIVFSLQILNQYSIQLKEKLVLGFDDQSHQLRNLNTKSGIEKQYNFFEIIKDRYRLSIKQICSVPKYVLQLDLCELETEITNKTDLKETIQHIIVNLTNQKLRLIVNGLSVALMNQDSVDYLCDTKFKFQFCHRNHEYEYSTEISQNTQGVYYLRLMSRNINKFYIYYLVQIIKCENTMIYQIEQLSKAPYIVKNNTSGPITISQNSQLKHKIDIDVGNTESFCWDCPFMNRQLQIEILHDTDKVRLNIEIDDFNNEELIIDKRIDKDLVQEFTIEVFQDEEERMKDINYQKLIVINQKTANRIINKNWQLKISQFGISVCNKEEILFIYAKDLQYKLNQSEGQINYEITFEQGAIQNQTCFLPSYNFKMYNAQKQNIKDQVFNSRLFRSIQQEQKDGFFYFKIIQKTQTEIMVHIQKVKLMLPSIKFKIDGNVVIKLFYFFKTLRDIKQKFQIDNSNEQRSFSQSNRYIKPKAIHFDKITISPFKFDVKFRNLQGIEECCSELFPRVGLLIFVLNKINQYSYVFQPYKFKDIKLSTEGNHLRAIQDFNLFYLNRLKENFEKQAMFSQFIRFQDSLQREFDNGLDQMQNIFDEDTNGQDLQFKFQILNTAFKLGQTFVSQTQQTLGTFLEGTIKYFETSGGGNQSSFSSGLNKILTKVSHFHKKIFIKHQIFSFDKLFNKKKLKRYPKYFDWNYKLEQYDEHKSKIQLYMQWRISQGTVFKKWYSHKLNDDVYLLISNSLFTVFNFDKNIIQLELNINQIHSIENIQDTLIIIYEKGNSDDEGMQKLKIEKYKINNVKNNQIKKVLAEMQGQSQQIYLLQMME